MCVAGCPIPALSAGVGSLHFSLAFRYPLCHIMSALLEEAPAPDLTHIPASWCLALSPPPYSPLCQRVLNPRHAELPIGPA